jgi:uncharacterized membrane protein (DUF4010 family)
MESVINIFIAIFIGAMIGLQREYIQQHKKAKNFAGIRTFIFITLLGAILGYLSVNFNSIWIILGFIFASVMSLLAYFLIYKNSRDVSGTTEVSFVIAYLLGAMATTGHLELAVVFGILTTTFLTLKRTLHAIAKKMDSKELVAMVEFALIAFVVLPFLPNVNYSPADIPGLAQIMNSVGVSTSFLSQIDVFNFHTIWLMVIFIAGINLAGYFLAKIFGSKKGYGITGFIGGIFSSTAVTISMAGESKKIKKWEAVFIATVIAAGIMFIRVLFEVSILNFHLLPILVIPLLSMTGVSFVIAFIAYKSKSNSKEKLDKVELEQPFALLPALKFGGFFALILFLSKFMQILFGKTGIYLTSFFSGLADVDAITLTMSNLSKMGSVKPLTATTAIIIAVMSNTLVKAGIAYFAGSKKFGRAVLLSLLFIIIFGLGILFIRFKYF